LRSLRTNCLPFASRFSATIFDSVSAIFLFS
jgi:hypothetical protein